MLLRRVNTARQNREFEQAISLCRARLTETDADLFALLANCYYALAQHNSEETGENYQNAINWMKKAIFLRPEDSGFHALLGEYYSLGTLEYEQAGKEFRFALSLEPNQVEVLRSAAALYGPPEADVTLEEATEWIRRATQLNPNDPTLHARLAMLLEEARYQNEAAEEWQKALVCPRPLEEGYAKLIATKK